MPFEYGRTTRLKTTRAFLPQLMRLMMNNSEADALAAGVSAMGIYLVMAIVLLVRPKGLFPGHA